MGYDGKQKKKEEELFYESRYSIQVSMSFVQHESTCINSNTAVSTYDTAQQLQAVICMNVNKGSPVE